MILISKSNNCFLVFFLSITDDNVGEEDVRNQRDKISECSSFPDLIKNYHDFTKDFPDLGHL